MPQNLDLSSWTWDQVKDRYPDLYSQYGPGSPGYQEPTAPSYYAPPGNLTGVVPSDYDQTYGGRPIVPNPLATGREAILGNLANLPNLMNIVRGINPNYDKQQGIIGDLLAGRVPTDVTAQLAQQAAERGVATGSPGSPNALANYLTRFLGTSYGMQRAGMGDANDLMARTYGMVSPSFITPEQQQAAQMAANIYASGPIPRMAAEQSLRDFREGLGEDRGVGPRTVLPTSITGGGTPRTPDTTGPLLGNQGGIIAPRNPLLGVGPAQGPEPAPYTGGYRWNPQTGSIERTGPVPAPSPTGYGSPLPTDQYGAASVRTDPTARLMGGGSTLYPTFNTMLGMTDPAMMAFGGFMGQPKGMELGPGEMYMGQNPNDYWANPNPEDLWSDFWGYNPNETQTDTGNWADPNDLWTPEWGYYGNESSPGYDDTSWLDYLGYDNSDYSDYVTDDSGWWDEYGGNFFNDVNVSDTADLSLAPLPSTDVGDYYDWSMSPDTGSYDSSWIDPFSEW